MRQYFLTALIALVAGFAGAALWSVTGLGHAQTRSYLVANPDILPEMAEAFQAQQAQTRGHFGGYFCHISALFLGFRPKTEQNTKTSRVIFPMEEQ